MSLDAGHRLITLVVLFVCGVVVGLQVVLCRPPVQWIPVLTAIVLLPTLGVCWALAPTALAIDGSALRIERRGWRALEIPLHEIAALESAPAVRMLNTVRIFGVGGFFGTFGLMWSRSLGRFRAYATHSAPSLLLRRRGSLPVLVTPDDPHALLAALRQAGVAA
jgi:PH (Pleckstrin Homology) domain-containing protein